MLFPELYLIHLTLHAEQKGKPKYYITRLQFGADFYIFVSTIQLSMQSDGKRKKKRFRLEEPIPNDLAKGLLISYQ